MFYCFWSNKCSLNEHKKKSYTYPNRVFYSFKMYQSIINKQTTFSTFKISNIFILSHIDYKNETIIINKPLIYAIGQAETKQLKPKSLQVELSITHRHDELK